MRVRINGNDIEVAASTLREVVEELGYDGAIIATAVNKSFVPRTQRNSVALHDGDAIEIIMPMRGG
ncbi:sulfur carrier protein ThiS [Xanthobacteraceae bacterium Astr-EGSB]|uniref:sulfur carrier protein ThiS n=1 Tax=Astrobacterium formosum TaxID=3069710 RepID=UPI0027AFE2FF|nr:sulfur carrier protein ThiS [Xanthobacteraceae bacterium Astr-EGSB]